MFSLPPPIENDALDTLQHLSALFEDRMRETHFVGCIPLILSKDVTVLHVTGHSSSFYVHFALLNNLKNDYLRRAYVLPVSDVDRLKTLSTEKMKDRLSDAIILNR